MKTRILNLFMVALLVSFVMACGNKSADTTEGEATHDHEMEGEHHDHEDMDHASTEGDAAKTEAQADVIVTAEDFKDISEKVAKSITESYLQLKDALVASDAAKSKDAASSILSALEGAEATTAIKGLKEDAQHIVDTDELEHIREHFDLMSQDVYALAKAKNTGLTLYKQYCPMAFDNQGAFWLSSSEEIRNPYFGDKMLKCGKVQEKIATN
ncbi:DUF3347 domain-containing protein [Fulvivirga kasyanovii]|uniref:DUF3347 domain-containing protein n=1 Tax=Fulvivirga kasyanovii TaxID=396812 RepID=A0ABW9RVZ4_9BACT|nr:DUF3347 domain-containing protein [Fulvivirga kasyanovii]MTI28231.1 DUF3347 domain-containing protein [Fulvivirga kasyanovii]